MVGCTSKCQAPWLYSVFTTSPIGAIGRISGRAEPWGPLSPWELHAFCAQGFSRIWGGAIFVLRIWFFQYTSLLLEKLSWNPAHWVLQVAATTLCTRSFLRSKMHMVVYQQGPVACTLIREFCLLWLWPALEDLFILNLTFGVQR